MSAPRSNRREVLMDAAARVVADKGMRGLTHRAVDSEAGVPQGSTSAYFRTRDALVTALTEHLAARLSADVGRVEAEIDKRPKDLDNAVEHTLALLNAWYDDETFTGARLELRMAARREPAVLEVYRPSHQALIDLTARIVDRIGLDHPRERAVTLLDAIDGVFVGSMTHGTHDAAMRQQAATSVRMLFEAIVPVPDQDA